MSVVCAGDIYSNYFTDSEMIYAGGCWLYSVMIDATSAGYGRIVVYDGSDDKGYQKFAIQCPADGHRHFNLAFPLNFNYGLYISVVQNLREGFVQLLPK